MATKIVTKNSSTASAVPTTSDLVQGELAVNVADGRLYTENASAAIVELGVNPAAEIQANAGVAFPDNQKATFGTGGDLEIYHNANTSFITESGSSNFKIGGQNLYLQNTAHNENYLAAIANEGVTLYYNNVAKQATTSTGIDVTGSVVADGLTINGSTVATFTVGAIGPSSNSAIRITRDDTTTGSGNPLGYLEFGGTDSTGNVDMPFAHIGAEASATHSAGSNATDLLFGTTPSGTEAIVERMRIDSSGNVLVGADTGNAFNSDSKLRIQAASGDRAFLQLKSDNDQRCGLLFGDTDDAVKGEINYDNTTDNMYFSVNDSERMRIDSSGNVGIGVTNAGSYDARAEKLVVGETGDAGITISSGATSDGRLVFAVTNQTDLSNGSITYDQSADSMAFETVGSERMRIDASGAVGFKKIPPSGSHTSWSQLFIGEKGTLISESSNSGGLYGTWLTDNMYIKQNTGAFANVTADQSSAYKQEAGIHQWFSQTSGSANAAITLQEHMRIDASGNLLVGTTNTLPAIGNVEGISLSAGSFGGRFEASRDGAEAVAINRMTNDGSLMSFKKDGSTVGTIGTKAGDLTIGDADVGLRFDTGAGLIPWNMTTNAATDATMDIGAASVRFKDAYLSGGVYLGGTGAANKLSDFETGTWTPLLSDGTNTNATYSVQVGTYTKIGNSVHVQGRLTTTALGSVSGDIQIAGLPFNSANVSNAYSTASFGYAGGLNISAGVAVTGTIQANIPRIAMRTWDATTGTTNMTQAEWSANGDIIFSAEYTAA